jgi:hypothetical protein
MDKHAIWANFFNFYTCGYSYIHQEIKFNQV